MNSCILNQAQEEGVKKSVISLWNSSILDDLNLNTKIKYPLNLMIFIRGLVWHNELKIQWAHRASIGSTAKCELWDNSLTASPQLSARKVWYYRGQGLANTSRPDLLSEEITTLLSHAQYMDVQIGWSSVITDWFIFLFNSQKPFFLSHISTKKYAISQLVPLYMSGKFCLDSVCRIIIHKCIYCWFCME